jgi:arginyl-tRNA---protein transferase
LYRPNQRNACCPHYTLRLDSSAYKPTRDQRQALNRFNRYVIGDDYAREAARCYPRSREESRRRNNVFDLAERVHEAEACLLKTPPEPAHHFTVALEPDTFTEEKYAVFENYQRLVHREPPHKISRGGFRRFLCNSPIRRTTLVPSDGPERHLGSYHQCYRLDGKLVAVGILDLLPSCVSAVYFMYHESIHHLNPGKLGAMREIALAMEDGYRWWYPGYYIHSCPKMRYKMDYSPQYLLDPETLEWDLLDAAVLRVFDKMPYVSLSRERRKGRFGPGVEPGKEGEDPASGDHYAYDSGDNSDEEDEILLKSKMPGIASLQTMMETNLDHIAIRPANHQGLGFYRTKDLSGWGYELVHTWGSLKAKIAELVAAMGPDLRPKICLELPTGPEEED